MMHLKTILFFFLVSAINPLGISAQTMNNSQLRQDSIPKKFFDKSTTRVYYNYSYREAPGKKKKEALTILQIGEQYNLFTDYAAIQLDSLYDLSAAKNGVGVEDFAILHNLKKQQALRERILINRANSQCTIQKQAGFLNTYQYEDPVPPQEWILSEGDTIIAGNKCKKATTRFRGRDYIAWYSSDIALPYGPYKFAALPGLIFCIYDTEDDYKFELTGLEKVKFNDHIYLVNRKKIIKSDRETVRKIEKNFYDNPLKALEASGITFKIEEADKPALKEKRPFNQIERE